VIFALTPDQDFLRETTEKFLGDQVPVAEIRRLRDDPSGFQAGYWKRGADLGWTSLLVHGDHGGGSVSDSGLIDLTLIAHEFGRHAAPGPLTPTNVVAAALSDAGGAHPAVLADLLSGAATAAWCFEERGGGPRLEDVSVEIRRDGSDVVIRGTKHPVESASEAGHLLVTGRTGDGLTQVLVPAGAPGLFFRPLQTVDMTRRFAAVELADVRVPADAVIGEVGKADADVERQLQLALVIMAAEVVGTLDRAFAMTVEWAFDRYSFGRPLASYQELKHRFADMKSWLEASHAITDAAAFAVSKGTPNAAELVSVAKAFVGHYGTELVQDCVQMHGGIGVTFDHDLHLYLRRATLNRSLFGTPPFHRRRIADIAIAEEAD
jgi:alkylation response protein AidB-like acyl-CoA dehydrogenase